TYTTTLIFTKLFEKKLRKLFGDFENTTFSQAKDIDTKYYKLFKTELIKLLIAIILFISSCAFLSKFNITQKLIEKERFNEVIKITTLGSKVFPIAPHWYSIRGYAYFQIDEYEKAIEDFNKAYKLEADGFNVMNFDNKIFVRYHMKDYETALVDFDTEINNANNDDERDQFLWDKAQFLYNIKKYNEALELYNDLIIKAENDRIFLLKDRLYMERAQVYKKLGKNDLAQADIEAANAEDIDQNKNYIPKPMLMLDEETFYSY
ncbi:MAG: tetratricopeptide repeat protein, partial [Candidatus Gastranaerophilales bacterium]|nr:tetratricopeptide repeat protein [Candidatus Gastranaerophilales bacterium]